MESRENRTISKQRKKQLEELIDSLVIHSESAPKYIKSKSQLKNLELIDEALTHTSARKRINHERLEFLGDAVLRLAASEFIDRNFPQMNVGERSALRAHLVSDRWLAEVGKKIKISDKLLIGPKALGDISARETLEAEATEALIGALYEYWQSLNQIHQWLNPYWHETSKAVLADPHRRNYKSALQEWSQGRGLKRPNYEITELSKKHGDPQRFFCKVRIKDDYLGEGWGGSRRDAEQKAAKKALLKIQSSKN